MHTRTHLIEICEICKSISNPLQTEPSQKKSCKTRHQMTKSAKVISTLKAICIVTVSPTQMTSTNVDCLLSLTQTAKHEDSHFAGT